MNPLWNDIGKGGPAYTLYRGRKALADGYGAALANRAEWYAMEGEDTGMLRLESIYMNCDEPSDG